MFGYREVIKCKCGKIYKFDSVLQQLPMVCKKCGRVLLVSSRKYAAEDDINKRRWWHDKGGYGSYFASYNVKLVSAKPTLFGWKESLDYGTVTNTQQDTCDTES